jgi:hypothetical protein
MTYTTKDSENRRLARELIYDWIRDGSQMQSVIDDLQIDAHQLNDAKADIASEISALYNTGDISGTDFKRIMSQLHVVWH